MSRVKYAWSTIDVPNFVTTGKIFIVVTNRYIDKFFFLRLCHFFPWFGTMINWKLVGQEPIRYKREKYWTRYNSNFIFFLHESIYHSHVKPLSDEVLSLSLSLGEGSMVLRPLVLRVNGPTVWKLKVGQWSYGPMVLWANGPMGQWSYGPMILRPLVLRINDPTGQWCY